MTATDRELNIFGVKVATSENDQILEAADDEELPVVDETEIPGSQERPLIGARACRKKRLLGELSLPPIPTSDAGSRDPNFANLAVGQRQQRSRVGNLEAVIGGDTPATHQSSRHGAAVNRVTVAELL